MSDQPTLFIGSSSGSIDYANALQSVLDEDLVASVWKYGVFLPGHSTLGGLVARAQDTDFAALFLTPDDTSVVSGEYLQTPRDNLVFELGLFIGCIGRERAFLITPRNGVDLPNDLQGITAITYRTDREDEDEQNAINPAATQIRTVAKRLGRRPRTPSGAATLDDAPALDVLVALGQLGAVVSQTEASLEMKRVAAGRFEIIVIDNTRLGTSVVIDLNDSAAVRGIDHLAASLRDGT